MSDSLLMSYLAQYGWALLIIFFAVVFVVLVTKDAPNQNEIQCRKICLSWNYTFDGYSKGGYQNPVCFCKDSLGRIYTFIV